MTPGSSGPRALVWGARGLIGRALVDHLLARGWDVRVLTRRMVEPSPSWREAVQWVELHGRDRGQAFDQALDQVSVVFNLAGSSGAVASNRDPIESLDSNCRLQLEFLAACDRAARHVHVVFASSRLVYAPSGRLPVTEGHPASPLSMYGAHKLCVEHYHRIASQRGGVSFTICRIANPYGLDESSRAKGYGFINALIQCALRREAMTLFGGGRQLRDYMHIDDLTTILRLCAERSEAMNEVINVGYGSSIPIYDAALQIQRVLGGGEIVCQPWPPEFELVESGDFVMDTSKAERLLDYRPVYSFESGLRRIKALAVAGQP